MQSRVAWLLAGFGIAAAAMSRFLRTPAPPPLPPVEPVQPEAPPEPDPRADELAQRIAETREIVDEREEFEESETPVDEADPENRRRHVHERGRAALERMRSDNGA
jgi:hypothetical protein